LQLCSRFVLIKMFANYCVRGPIENRRKSIRVMRAFIFMVTLCELKILILSDRFPNKSENLIWQINHYLIKMTRILWMQLFRRRAHVIHTSFKNMFYPLWKPISVSHVSWLPSMPSTINFKHPLHYHRLHTLENRPKKLFLDILVKNSSFQ